MIDASKQIVLQAKYARIISLIVSSQILDPEKSPLP